VARRVRSLSIALVIVLIASVVWSAACSAGRWGQQPKRSREPYVTPLLPAEQAWSVTLPSSPSAAAAMDSTAIYVPLEPLARVDDDGEETSRPAELVALSRATGVTRWSYPVATRQPPVVAHGLILVAGEKEIHAVDPERGERQWRFEIDRAVRAPMLARGALLLALLDGDELLAVDLGRRQIAWRRSIGESGPVLMMADDQAAYLVTAGSRAMRVMLKDGSLPWERQLQGELSEPTVDRGRLYVGANTTPGLLWALDAETGNDRWMWDGRVLAGAVVGIGVAGETVYVASKDNMIHALNRGNGNQRWQKAAGTRPETAPQLLEGIFVVSGGSPRLATFRADTGAAISTWAGPEEKVLMQGPPLIDEPQPMRVSIVVLFRNGLAIGLTPAAMLFKEPALTPFTTVPGRALPRER
jgi:outer membrane protein assembly factor BamB